MLRDEYKEKNEVIHSHEKQPCSYDPDAPGEVMRYKRWHDGPSHIILDYLHSDIYPVSQQCKIKDRHNFYSQFKLFGHRLQDIMIHDLVDAATCILRGESEDDLEEVLALIEKKPFILHLEVEAKDLLGRRVKGTLLQIAAMAGDINVKEGIKDEKDWGMAESLIKRGKLSQQEITKQLECLTSKEAKRINVERKQRIISTVIQFVEAVIQKTHKNSSDDDFKPFIEQFERNLQAATDEVITMGYVFDISILHDVVNWLKKNVYRFNNSMQSTRICCHAIGTLQKKLSSRDAQIIQDPNYLSHIAVRGSLSSFYNNDPLGKYYFLFAYERSCYFNGHKGGREVSVSHPHRIYDEDDAEFLQEYYFTLMSRREQVLEHITKNENKLIKFFRGL